MSDPVLNKDGITQFTSYKLQGLKIPKPLTRRYRDFDALRKKFLERWPGVFIPNIPPKKVVGSTDKDTVEFRIEMLNIFLNKLSNIDYLFNSDEMELFLLDSNNIPKTMENIKVDSYEELLKKYASVFTDYDDNFDTTTGKNEQDAFYIKLNNVLPKLKNFRAFILQEKERYSSFQQNYITVINMLSFYEKDIMSTYVNNDEKKLVFFNMKNVNLCKNISNVQEKIKNPYEHLYDSITEDLLDVESMQEALESLKGLQDSYNKLTKNLTTVNEQLNDLQVGKTNIMSLLSFKGKEENMNKLTADKEKIEKEIEQLGKVIQITTFNMHNEIKKFKNVSLEKYYKELNQIYKDIERNAKINDELWDTVIKDKNISKYK